MYRRAIVAVILVSTWELLSDSLRLSLDGTPQGIEVSEIRELMLKQPHVEDVHHMHIWAISTTENALTAHIVVDELQNEAEVKHLLKHSLAEAGINHATLETETDDCVCEELSC